MMRGLSFSIASKCGPLFHRNTVKPMRCSWKGYKTGGTTSVTKMINRDPITREQKWSSTDPDTQTQERLSFLFVSQPDCGAARSSQGDRLRHSMGNILQSTLVHRFLQDVTHA